MVKSDRSKGKEGIHPILFMHKSAHMYDLTIFYKFVNPNTSNEPR